MSTLTAVKHLPISSKSSSYFDKNSIKDISHQVDVFFIENGLFTTRALNITPISTYRRLLIFIEFKILIVLTEILKTK